MSIKNYSDSIGNRTHNPPGCSAVPWPTAPPRAPLCLWDPCGNLQGDHAAGNQELRRCLQCFGRPLPTSKLELLSSTIWQIVRQILHRMWFGRWLAKHTGGFFVDRLVLNLWTVTVSCLRIPYVYYFTVILAEKRILFGSDFWVHGDLLETMDSVLRVWIQFWFFFTILSSSFWQNFMDCGN